MIASFTKVSGEPGPGHDGAPRGVPGYDGGHRDQEVLGEQLRSADGEKDETYPEGQ